MLLTGSIRKTLVAVVLLSMLPAMGLILYSALSDREREIERSRNDARELARAIAYKKHNLVESTQTVLLAVSSFDEVQNKDLPAVRAIFRTITHQASFYANLALLSPEGRPLVVAHPPKNPDALFQPALFTEAIKRSSLYIGLVTSGAQGSFLYFANPVYDATDALTAVMVGGLNTDIFHVALDATVFPPGGRVRILDKRGNTLFAHPDRSVVPAEERAGQRTLARYTESEGMVPHRTVSGEARTLVYQRLFLTNSPEPYMTVVLSLPETELSAVGDQALNRALLMLGLSMLMAFLIIRLLGETSIAVPVRTVLKAARTLRKGDLSVRTDADRLKGEMKVLGGTFNRMAGALEARELELIRARNLSREYDVKKGEFLAAMSHAIRTPMSSVIGVAYLLMKTPLNPRQYGYVNRIYSSANTLMGIINDILDFSNIESGRFAIEHTRFQLSETLDNVIALCAQRAEERGLALETEVAEGVPDTLYGDSLRLSQVLTNLVGNAVKFTEQGGVRVLCAPARDEAACPDREDGGRPLRLRFEVRDTGIGMTAAQLSVLFNAFTQADETISRRFGGTGLGLVITKRLVELMGGAIHAESEYGHGTRMIFTICAGEMDPSATAASHASGTRVSAAGTAGTGTSATGTARTGTAGTGTAGTGAARTGTAGTGAARTGVIGADAGSGALSAAREESAPSLAGVHVLLVEDNLVNREIAAALLEEAGAMVSQANNGAEALALLGADNPSGVEVVLMDVRMPVMDGHEATRRIRAVPGLAGLPIIAMTAHAMAEERELCMAVGMNAHLSKPIEFNKFYSTITGCLHDHSRREQD